MEEKYSIPDIGWEKVMQVVDAVGHGCTTRDKVIQYCKSDSGKTGEQKDREYVGRAISVATQLGFLTICGDKLNLQPGVSPTTITGLRPEDAKVIFRQQLQKYPPFLKFFHFINLGIAPRQAAKRVCAIFEITREPEPVGRILTKWGIAAGVFSRKAGAIEVAEKLKIVSPQKIQKLVDALDSDLKAREYLAKILTDEALETLEIEQVDDLTFSLTHYAKDPDGSIHRAGKVLEDYLRIVAKIRNISLKGNGITQIATELRQKKAIASKHVAVLQGLEVFMEYRVLAGLAAFRNMSGHGIDRVEQMRWDLSEELAITYVVECILTIKSLWFYAVKRQLVY